MRTSLSRAFVALWSTAALAAAASPPADAAVTPVGKPIQWAACPDVDGWQCATVRVPKDYSHPGAGSFKLAVTRLPASDPAHRIGSLFVNYGGPGADAVASTQSFGADLFAGLTSRFDLVAFDPRGTGATVPSIDCHVDQRKVGLIAQPFTTPENLDAPALIRQDQGYVNACYRNNRGVLPYVTTANVARDMDG